MPKLLAETTPSLPWLDIAESSLKAAKPDIQSNAQSIHEVLNPAFPDASSPLQMISHQYGLETEISELLVIRIKPQTICPLRVPCPRAQISPVHSAQ